MSFPTIEQIAELQASSTIAEGHAILAREIIALRASNAGEHEDQVEWIDNLRQRVEIIERNALEAREGGDDTELDHGVTREMLAHDLLIAQNRAEAAERELLIERDVSSVHVETAKRCASERGAARAEVEWLREALRDVLANSQVSTLHRIADQALETES